MVTGHRTPNTGQDRPLHRHWRRKQDAFTRLMHAVLAMAFLGAWLTAEWDGLRAWHVAFGHATAAALLLRVAGALARPRPSLGRWWRVMAGAAHRLLSGHPVRSGREGLVGTLRPATWSIAALAAVVCSMLVLVPGSFVSGWVLSRLIDAPTELVSLHRWLGTALMVAVATHVALIGVLGVLRGRCMACDSGKDGG